MGYLKTKNHNKPPLMYSKTNKNLTSKLIGHCQLYYHLLTLSRSTTALAVVIILHFGKFFLVDRERVNEQLITYLFIL